MRCATCDIFPLCPRHVSHMEILPHFLSLPIWLQLFLLPNPNSQSTSPKHQDLKKLWEISFSIYASRNKYFFWVAARLHLDAVCQNVVNVRLFDITKMVVQNPEPIFFQMMWSSSTFWGYRFFLEYSGCAYPGGVAELGNWLSGFNAGGTYEFSGLTRKFQAYWISFYLVLCFIYILKQLNMSRHERIMLIPTPLTISSLHCTKFSKNVTK